MRNLSFCKNKWDKKFLLAFIITLICSIICGIVLYKSVTIIVYFRDFADEYVYNVFNFNNSSLFLSHFISDIFYFYIIFLICYFTKFKYLSLILLYLRGIFFGVYSVLLLINNSVGGILVLLFVFLPTNLISIAVCFLIAEFCKNIDFKYVFIIPAVLALVDAIILMLLVNVVFRVVIIIV